MESMKKYEIERVKKESCESLNDYVIIEYPLDIEVDGRLVETLYCSPQDLELLVIGHIYTRGIIQSYQDIGNIKILENKAVIELKSKKGLIKKNKAKQIKLDRNKVFDLVKNFENKSEIFKATGGAHSCALIRNHEIIKFEEDVARSNAVDKLIGYVLKEDLDISEIILLTSCRISSTIIDKVKLIGFKTIITVACPTSYAIDYVRNKQINLIGFARGERFNVYNKTETLDID